MNRRTALKWLHWGSLFLMLYFFFVEPEDVERLGAAALATHAGVGFILAVVVVAWFAMFVTKGLASRAGPKLPAWAKKAHPLMHKGMYWLVLAMVLSGGLIGLFAPYSILAFGAFPISPNFDVKLLHELAEEVHEVLFDLCIYAVVAHAIFHIWRHCRLKDNALRIMAPKALHKYL